MNARIENQLTRLRPLMLAIGVALFALLLLSAQALADRPTPGEPPTAPDPTPAPSTEAPQIRAAAAGLTQFTYLPVIQAPQTGLFVNPQNKGESAAFFRVHYTASDGQEQARVQAQSADAGAAGGVPPLEWTGSQSNCDEGELSQEFRDAMLDRINYFRAMAGVPANVQFSDEFNRKAQKAALMMSVNRRMSHTPTPDWTCYSEDGSLAARSSNLYLGVYSLDAISGYIADPGSGNSFVGHRRWILYPQTQYMGTGDIPDTPDYPAANVLWVFDDNMWEPRPETRTEFVAWPPAGYTPYQVVFSKWSFSYPNADFSGAAVAMTRVDGSGVALTVYDPMNGFGENTLVWRPDISLERPASDIKYIVRIDNVLIDGVARTFTYDVTVFDPDA